MGLKPNVSKSYWIRRSG